MDAFHRFYLSVLTAIFAVVAVLAALSPEVLFDPITVDLGVDPAGRAEIRAAYLGLFGTAAAGFGLGSWRAPWRRPATIAAVLVLGGFVAGRLFSLAVDGVPNAIAWAMIAAEATGLLIGLALAWRGRSP